jgi:protein-disulfide isomerase
VGGVRWGLHIVLFEADRRSAEVAERIDDDFRSGIRAGVATTPTQFVGRASYPGVPGASLRDALR